MMTVIDLANAVHLEADALAQDAHPGLGLSPGDTAHLAALRFAQRVLEALAEEPNEEMLEAGGTADGVLHIDADECTIFPAVVWRAMLSALLARAGGGG